MVIFLALRNHKHLELLIIIKLTFYCLVMPYAVWFNKRSRDFIPILSVVLALRLTAYFIPFYLGKRYFSMISRWEFGYSTIKGKIQQLPVFPECSRRVKYASNWPIGQFGQLLYLNCLHTGLTPVATRFCELYLKVVPEVS